MAAIIMLTLTLVYLQWRQCKRGSTPGLCICDACGDVRSHLLTENYEQLSEPTTSSTQPVAPLKDSPGSLQNT